MFSMRHMNVVYGLGLDLNLLRVFVVVAERGSVTAAAADLYLTQPAVSAALRRLVDAVGAPLFARQGRGLTLTRRGARLLSVVRPHLNSLVEAALSPEAFEPATSDRTLRIGLADAAEPWLVPALLRLLRKVAPKMRVVVVPVQFRTVGEALATRRIDVAVTVADELPASIQRRTLFVGDFVCLFDSRHVRARKRMTEGTYFAHEHVVVSYNGDLRGIVEDKLRKARNVRCSVSSFANLGAIIEGTPLLATIPRSVAGHAVRARKHLRTAELPFDLSGAPMEMLWSRSDDDDPAGAFLREAIVSVTRATLA